MLCQVLRHGRKIILVAVLATSIGAAAQGKAGQVDPSVHSRCVEARDYQGCVNAHTGEATNDQEIIIREGAPVSEGNACPSNMAYAGGGLCRAVICHDPGIFDNGHEPPLGGKNWTCRGFNTGLMKWGSSTGRAFFDDTCPKVPLKAGWMNTCYQEGIIKGIIRPGGTGRFQ